MHVSLSKIALGISLAFLFGNILYIDIVTLNKGNSPISQKPTSEVTVSPQIQQIQTIQSQSCPVACINDIQLATASVTLIPQTLPVQTQTSSVKEFFIPFGSGSSIASDWQDVPGLQAYVNSYGYGKIKSIVLEVSVHVPTANETATVRLFNVTDKHPVWFSDVLFTGGAIAQLLISQPITLDSGNKLYQIQMKTQLQSQAIIDQSRLHIITD